MAATKRRMRPPWRRRGTSVRLRPEGPPRRRPHPRACRPTRPQAVLRFAPQAAQRARAQGADVSAVANAEHNDRTSTVTTLVRQRGLRRRGPDAASGSGRARRAARTAIRKRTSHITVVVVERESAAGRRPPRRSGHRQPRARPRRRARRPSSTPAGTRRRKGPASGPEGQPARVPLGHHHRLQEPVVRRTSCYKDYVERGRRDPAAHVQGSWSAPASPRSRSSAPVTGSGSTSTPRGRAS